MLTKTKEGQLKDVQILKPNSNDYAITKNNYVVPKGEESKYHAIIEIKQFNNADGSRLSKPRIQKFGQKWFESHEGESNLKRQGYDIIVLHDPREWVEKNAGLVAEAKAKKVAEIKEKREAAEQERINAGVQSALAALGVTPEMLKAAQTTKTVKKTDETK